MMSTIEKGVFILLLLLMPCWSYPVDSDNVAHLHIDQRISKTTQDLVWLQHQVTLLSDLLDASLLHVSAPSHGVIPQVEEIPSKEYDTTELSNALADDELFYQMKDNERTTEWQLSPSFAPFWNKVKTTAINWMANDRSPSAHSLFREELKSSLRKRAENATQLVPNPDSLFIPPPKTDLTPAVVNDSMNAQPQNIGTISSVIPHFTDGKISFHVQMRGFVASTIILNSTTSLPCDTVGTQPGPNLVVLPRLTSANASQAVLPNCLIIAVNMYNPTVISYWVQKPDGSIYSIAGDNKIYNLNQVDQSATTPLALRAISDLNVKREEVEQEVAIETDSLMIRNQVYPLDCGSDCPQSNMMMLQSNTSTCGCVVTNNTNSIEARGILPPNWHNAVMAPEACAGMTCLANNGQPALYNPFSRTCWCVDPVHAEVSST